MLSEVQSALGYVFHNPELLDEALTHKSFFQGRHETNGTHNERLEFLGDAVLGLVICEYIAGIFPNANEGELSKIKAFLVSRPSLAKASKRLHLGQWLKLGRGEEATKGRQKSSLLANVLEAVIAAVYIDGGSEAAKAFTFRALKPELDALSSGEARGVRGDYKSHLQEYSHKKFNVTPDYRLVRESGPDHQKAFEVEVLIGGQVRGRGVGKTKKEAEQVSARQALEIGMDGDVSVDESCDR